MIALVSIDDIPNLFIQKKVKKQQQQQNIIVWVGLLEGGGHEIK